MKLPRDLSGQELVDALKCQQAETEREVESRSFGMPSVLEQAFREAL